MEDTRYKLSPDVLTVATTGENVLMDYASGKYFGLRGAAALLADPLREGMSLPEMAEMLSAHYAVSLETAEEDLRKILPRLLEAGLVHRVEGVPR